MKILYFTDTYLPKVDGIAVSISSFVEILTNKGHEVLICCPSYSDDDKVQLPKGVETIRFLSGSLPSYPDIKIVFPSIYKIIDAIQSFKPDLVHVHTPGLLGLYGIATSKQFHLPVVGTYHTLISEQNTYISLYRLLKLDKLFEYLNNLSGSWNIMDLVKISFFNTDEIRKKIVLEICNFLYNRCDLIISPSHLIKAELKKFGIQKDIQVISNGIDLSKFSSKIKNKIDLNLLHVGRISYEKNCDVIIKAFKIIQDQFPASTLTIIGEGPAISSLKSLARNLDIEKSVIWKGFISHEMLPEEYPNYDLFLTASTMETQGLVILEALAHGIPAVGVDSYAIPELIIDGKNGFIVPPFDIEKLAKKSIEILQSEKLYKEFSKFAIEIAREHDIQQCALVLEQTYSKLIEI